ncbi:MAG: hypothetical protein IPO13_07005 [Rhodocyclaceae bacterium]|nr:hypothetical protein [Rhodocyclaceae bacterium]
MNNIERRIYDAIIEKIRDLSVDDDFRDYELLVRLRRGRMIRLRQCMSYARLLGSAISEYSEDLIKGEMSLVDSIKHYDELESPAKLAVTIERVGLYNNRARKWSFGLILVETLRLLQSTLVKAGHKTELIYGGTPTEANSVDQGDDKRENNRRFRKLFQRG